MAAVMNRQMWKLFQTSGHERAYWLWENTPITEQNKVPTMPTISALEMGGMLRNNSSGLLPSPPPTNPIGMAARHTPPDDTR